MTAVISGTNGLLQAYDYQVSTTGFSYTFAAGTQVLVMNPAGTLATGTITMPASPADGMTITFSSSQQITALTMAGNGATISGATTSMPAKSGVTYVYRATGTTWYPTTAVPFFPSMVRLNNPNGLGSTNTTIRRFLNVTTNQGTDITYADSATLGASFTINTTGVYAISYTDTAVNSVSTAMGLTLNCTQNSTTFEQITDNNVLLSGGVTTGPNFSTASFTGQITAGGVVRATIGGAGTNSYNKSVLFSITRVA